MVNARAKKKNFCAFDFHGLPGDERNFHIDTFLFQRTPYKLMTFRLCEIKVMNLIRRGSGELPLTPPESPWLITSFQELFTKVAKIFALGTREKVRLATLHLLRLPDSPLSCATGFSCVHFLDTLFTALRYPADMGV